LRDDNFTQIISLVVVLLKDLLISFLLVLVVGDQDLLVGDERGSERLEAVEHLLEELLVSETLLCHQDEVLDEGLEEDSMGLLQLCQALLQGVTCLGHLLFVVLEKG
jgi:hypothetical protein